MTHRHTLRVALAPERARHARRTIEVRLRADGDGTLAEVVYGTTH